MNKLSHWLTGAASVLAALFANVASGNAAGGETQPPETQQNVPDVSAAARDQIGTKASRIGQDEVIIDKPQIDPGEEKGKVTFAESDDKIWFKDSSPFKEGNTPSFSDNKGFERGNPVLPGVETLGGIKSSEIGGNGTPPFDEGTPPFDEFQEHKPDENSMRANPAPDVQGAFDKNQLPQAPMTRGE